LGVFPYLSNTPSHKNERRGRESTLAFEIAVNEELGKSEGETAPHCEAGSCEKIDFSDLSILISKDLGAPIRVDF